MKNEEELIEEVLDGNFDSFAALLHPYRQLILNIGYRMTGNYEEAKEISQEVLLKIFRHLKSFKKCHCFKNWIYKTTINCGRDFLKKRSKHLKAVKSQETFPSGRETSEPEDRYLSLEIRENIKRCLQVLTPHEKAIFLLRDEQGLSIKETARIVGCSSLSVRAHLCRARRKIRDQFLKIYSLHQEAKG